MRIRRLKHRKMYWYGFRDAFLGSDSQEEHVSYKEGRADGAHAAHRLSAIEGQHHDIDCAIFRGKACSCGRG